LDGTIPLLSDVGMPEKVCIATPDYNSRHRGVTLYIVEATTGMTLLYRYYKNERDPQYMRVSKPSTAFTRLMAEVRASGLCPA
jgi:hypothetical protein